jgi:hypothetical protein
VCESKGVWVGRSSDDPNSHKIHWPMTGTVTVKCDDHFEDEMPFGGEMRDKTLAAMCQQRPLGQLNSE